MEIMGFVIWVICGLLFVGIPLIPSIFYKNMLLVFIPIIGTVFETIWLMVYFVMKIEKDYYPKKVYKKR